MFNLAILTLSIELGVKDFICLIRVYVTTQKNLMAIMKVILLSYYNVFIDYFYKFLKIHMQVHMYFTRYV